MTTLSIVSDDDKQSSNDATGIGLCDVKHSTSANPTSRAVVNAESSARWLQVTNSISQSTERTAFAIISRSLEQFHQFSKLLLTLSPNVKALPKPRQSCKINRVEQHSLRAAGQIEPRAMNTANSVISET